MEILWQGCDMKIDGEEEEGEEGEEEEEEEGEGDEEHKMLFSRQTLPS